MSEPVPLIATESKLVEEEERTSKHGVRKRARSSAASIDTSKMEKFLRKFKRDSSASAPADSATPRPSFTNETNISMHSPPPPQQSMHTNQRKTSTTSKNSNDRLSFIRNTKKSIEKKVNRVCRELRKLCVLKSNESVCLLRSKCVSFVKFSLAHSSNEPAVPPSPPSCCHELGKNKSSEMPTMATMANKCVINNKGSRKSRILLTFSYDKRTCCLCATVRWCQDLDSLAIKKDTFDA